MTDRTNPACIHGLPGCTCIEDVLGPAKDPSDAEVEAVPPTDRTSTAQRVEAADQVHEARNKKLDLLDRLHVVACLLYPFSRDTGAIDGHPFFPVGDQGDVLDYGWRFLPRVVEALDSANEALDKLGECPTDVLEAIVPMRHTIHSLEVGWRMNDFDFLPPDNATDILRQCYYQVHAVARRFDEETAHWWSKHRDGNAAEEVAHV